MPVFMELAYNQAHALVMLAFMDRLATEVSVLCKITIRILFCIEN